MLLSADGPAENQIALNPSTITQLYLYCNIIISCNAATKTMGIRNKLRLSWGSTQAEAVRLLFKAVFKLDKYCWPEKNFGCNNNFGSEKYFGPNP